MNAVQLRVDARPEPSAFAELWRASWNRAWTGNLDTVLAHSLVHACAYDGERLVGYVNVAWDGGKHAFLLDPTIHPDYQRQGLGTRLVRRATEEALSRGLEWLHVDYEPHLQPFYEGCGFTPTPAGLIYLPHLRQPPVLDLLPADHKGPFGRADKMAGDTPLYEHHEKDFAVLVNGAAQLELLYDNCRWAEGPVWFGDLNCLLWSDIPNDRMMRWVPAVGTSVFREPAGNTNGHTRDREGRLVSCSHGNRHVERTEHNGKITVLATHYNGKRLNSPNDVVVKSDGSIWFTDPAYGIASDYEGFKGEQEQPACHVFRIDPGTGEVTVVADDFDRPNGLAFSPDESILYIADSGNSYGGGRPHHIRALDVTSGNKLRNSRVFCDIEPGVPDGLRLDTEGNVWTSAGNGVQVFSPSGVLRGRINTPKTAANVAFGGKKKNWLFIAATDCMWLLHTQANGAQTP